MTFIPKKFNEVFEDMRRRTTVITDFEVGSVARTMYESFAFEIALLYEKMRLVYLSAYVDTAEGQQLDLVVSVLGIKRGLPDFAEGVVTFQRDVGKEDIVIPVGTLVATEDTLESPKKVYQTIEPKIALKDRTGEDVKVQAVNRGEQEVTPAETIVVTPRPIPGIKSVINQEATRFIGKRRETDEELRERAKNALISSGKATILSIENALLSLPGVRDVKVIEKFHFARGKITLTRGALPGEIAIPKDVTLTANGSKPFKTTELVVLVAGENQVDVSIQSLLEGKAGEVEAPGAAWTISGSPDVESLSPSNDSPIALGEFGVIEVFVDSARVDDPTEKQRLQDEIDRVRAAGIFVLLEFAHIVNVDAVFKIDIRPDLKLSPEERAEFEASVKTEIEKYISERKMGAPALFSQIIKNTLSLDGVDNLEDFTITIRKQQNGVVKSFVFGPAAKRIEIEEFEKFAPHHICVASETKSLPVHIQFKADNLDSTKQEAVLMALGAHFDQLRTGDQVSKAEIQSLIATALGEGQEEITMLQLDPEPWCVREDPSADDDVHASFVERAVLGEVFAFSKFLTITGALKLTLPATITDESKRNIRIKIKEAIEAYIENLKADADVVFADLISIASTVESVLSVDLDPADFGAALNGQEAVGRISDKKIEVQAFEKTQLRHFCITGDIESVNIEVTALGLEVLFTGPPPSEGAQNAVIAAIKLAVKNAVNNFLSGATAGQDLVYINLKNAIQNLVPGANYSVMELSLEATSSCDSRDQETNIETARDIHVRSVEIAQIQPLTEDDVNVTVRTI